MLKKIWNWYVGLGNGGYLTIISALIGAAGSIGGSQLQARGQKKAAKAASRRPTQHQIPLPGRGDAVATLLDQILALNAGRTPPSFGDWVKSGGTETFGLQYPGLTPNMVRQLGLIDRTTGAPIPWVQPSTAPGGLNAEQALFLGQQLSRQGVGRSNLAVDIATLTRELEKMSRLPATPKRKAQQAKREARLESDISRMGGR